MCGRLTQIDPAKAVRDLFDLELLEALPARYNVAPGQDILVVRGNPESGKREAVSLHWGLIPAWSKDKKIAYKLVNARAETAASKPSFRSAFRHRRCLIPTEGFYEWKPPSEGRKAKQPYYIQMRDHEPFALAGLWEHWENKDSGEIIESCTILTTEANDDVRELHDRMPVIIDPKDFRLWLDPSAQRAEDVKELLRPAAGGILTTQTVSTLVNSPKNEGRELLNAI